MKKKLVKNVVTSILCIAGISWYLPCVWAAAQPENADKDRAAAETEKAALASTGCEGISLLADSGISTYVVDGNAGGWSVAVGEGSNAGGWSVAVGYQSNADAYAVTVGYQSNAGGWSVAVGQSSSADKWSVAVGQSSSAGEEAVAVGQYSSAGKEAVAVGLGSKAGDSAVAIGYKSYSDIENTVSFGDVTGTNNRGTKLYRDLEGIQDIAVNGGIDFTSGHSGEDGELQQGEIRGVTRINSITFNGNSLTGVGMINDVSISKTGGSIIVGDINITEMSNQVKGLRDDVNALQCGSGGSVSDEDLQGISRKDVDTEGKGTTVIEQNTSISKEGIVTNNIAATSGTIGGVTFDAGKINGIDIRNLQNDVNSLTGRVESLENSGGSGGSSATNPDTAGIKRPDVGETVIEGNTTITSEGIKTDKVEAGSISVDTEVKYTETGDDGKETEKTTTSNVTIGNGDVKLDRVDESGNHSQMYVGEEIDKINSNMQDMGNAINKLGGEIDEVGALSAALAGLHPQPENANSRADFAMAMGSYDGEQALAVGGFYRPDKRTMLSVGASTTSSRHMFNMGVSVALDKMSAEKREVTEPKKMAGNNEAMADMLERLEKLEADNQAMRADNEKMRFENAKMRADNKEMRFENEKMRLRYEALAADYEELKAKYGIKNVTAEEMRDNAEKLVQVVLTALPRHILRQMPTAIFKVPA